MTIRDSSSVHSNHLLEALWSLGLSLDGVRERIIGGNQLRYDRQVSIVPYLFNNTA